MWKQIKIHHKSFHGQLGAVELMKKMMADIMLPYNVGEVNLKDEPFFQIQQIWHSISCLWSPFLSTSKYPALYESTLSQCNRTESAKCAFIHNMKNSKLQKVNLQTKSSFKIK